MASFFSKFLRGASGAGAKLYADKAIQDSRAEITAKRDAVLEANRTTRETSRREFELKKTSQEQTFRSEEAELGREFRSEEAELGREFRARESAKGRAATAANPQAQLAKLRLEDAKTMSGLKKQYSAAKNDTDRFEIVKQIMAASGRPVEGQRKVPKSTGISLMQSVVKMIQEEQKEEFIRPGDEGYKTTQDMLNEAQQMVKTVLGTSIGAPPPAVTGPASRVDEILAGQKGKGTVREILEAIINDAGIAEVTKEDARKRLKG